MVTPMIVDFMLKDVSHLLYIKSDSAFNDTESKEDNSKAYAQVNGSNSVALELASDKFSGKTRSEDPNAVTINLNVSTVSEMDLKEEVFDAYYAISSSPILLPYFMPAIGLLLAVMIYIAMVIFERDGTDKHDSKAREQDTNVSEEKTKVPLFLVAILMLFTLLVGALECTYGGWIVAFVIRYLNDSYTNAATASTCFWGANALGRGVSVITTKIFKLKHILGVHLLLLTLSITLLIIACDQHIVVTWLCSLLYGFSLAPLLGLLMMYCNKFVPLPEWLISLIHCNLYVGFMVVPALVGYLFAKYTPLFLLYGLLFCIAIMLMLFAILCIYERKVLYKLKRSVEVDVSPDISDSKMKDKLKSLKEIDIYRSQSSLC